MGIGCNKLKSGIVMVGLYFQVWILEESRPLTIFKMPWVGEFLGSLAYIFKFMFVELWATLFVFKPHLNCFC